MVVRVQAELTLLSTEEGGRRTAIASGYRPNHVFEGTGDQGHWFGQIVFDGDPMEPGESGPVSVDFMYRPGLRKYLAPGTQWRIQEGARLVGTAVITRVEKLPEE